MSLPTLDISSYENLNKINTISIHTEINRHDDFVEEHKLMISKVGNIAKESIKLQTTFIVQDTSQEENKTFIENNRKPQLKKDFFITHPTMRIIPNSFYIELKEYNGCVSEIDSNKQRFKAILTNISDDNEKLEAEFDISDINSGDIKLLRIGALFIGR